jgi:hypothetical protein
MPSGGKLLVSGHCSEPVSFLMILHDLEVSRGTKSRKQSCLLMNSRFELPVFVPAVIHIANLSAVRHAEIGVRFRCVWILFEWVVVKVGTKMCSKIWTPTRFPPILIPGNPTLLGFALSTDGAVTLRRASVWPTCMYTPEVHRRSRGAAVYPASNAVPCGHCCTRCASIHPTCVYAADVHA